MADKVIFGISMTPLGEPHERRGLRILAMVHELHKAGYQRLRICPGMSASGGCWRCAITPVTNIFENHGALLKETNDLIVAAYTSGSSNAYFGWKDATKDNARRLAAKFIERFPKIARAGEGEDWAYAGWFVQMLGFAENGDFPMAYADFSANGKDPDPGFLPSTRHWFDSRMPMPPAGQAKETM